MIELQTISFRHEQASAKLERLEPGIYSLRNVWSQSRGNGHATGVIEKVVRFADRHGLTLVLMVQPYGRPDSTMLDATALELFYKKFGFVPVRVRKPIKMIRYPASRKV